MKIRVALTKNDRKQLKAVYVLLASAVILSFAGYWNMFPLLHWDTAVYLFPAFEFYVPKDRPVIYGFFARLTSFDYSLWMTVFIQGLFVSLTIWYYLKHIFRVHNRNITLLVIVCILSVFTTVSFYVSYILPDIFISLAVLNLGLLFFGNSIKNEDLIIVSLIFMLSSSVHNSHFVITGLLLVLVTILFVFRKCREFLPLSTRRLLHIWAAFVLAFLISSSIHYMLPRTGEWVFERSFTTGSGGHVFLVSKLNQTGILKDYLDKNCEKKHYKICRYKDSIPANMDFMWKDYSPLYKTGGWHANREDFRSIIFDVFTTPEYLLKFTYKSIESTAVQFFSFGFDTIPEIETIHFSDSVYTTFYPAYANEYREARQNTKGMPQLVSGYNTVQRIIFFPALLFILLLPFLRVSRKVKLFGLYVLLALIVNAFVCSSLSAVDPRYQGRLIWIILLPAIFMISERGFSEQVYRLFRRTK